MTDRKEPPFFNDSVGTFHHKLPFYDTMDLFIETLTGTCFELRVLPYEAVISVKTKIQQLEGIPVAQQHLIWNNLELDDEHCLHDYGIAEGCTLKLVLALRGGPINTRRVTIEDPVKEVADLMEGTREQGFEKGVSNKQVTLVVYREGDKLNFFRVVDRGDDTLTPLAKSLKLAGGSVYKVHTEEEEEEEDGESSAATQQNIENSITMSKMKMLKAKMDDMNLNKKPKKSAKLKPRPPVSPAPCGGAVGPSSTRHHQRLLCTLPQTNQIQQSNTQLPPVGHHSSNLCTPSLCAHLSVCRRAPSFSSPSCYMLEEKEEEEPWEASPPFANIRPPPKVSRLDIGSARFMRDCVYPQLPPLYTRGTPEATFEAAEASGEAMGLGLFEESTGLLEPSNSGATFGELSHTLSLDVSTQSEGGHRTFEVGAQHQLPLSPSPISSWPRETNDAITSRAARTRFGSSLHVNTPSPLPTSPSPTTKLLPQPFDSFLQPVLQAQIKTSSISPHPSTTSSHPLCPHDVKVESPGKIPEFISKKEMGGITKMSSQAYQSDSAELLASLSQRASDNCRNDCFHKGLGLTLALPLAAPSGQSNLGGRVPSVPAHSLGPDDGVRQMSPLHRATASYMVASSLTSAGGLTDLFGRTGAPTYQLPPVKPPTGSKKSCKHCFLCGKKTGLATSYKCRCGHSFCATHRYAETHDCSYDYKSAGRRLLQQTNPLISAPKLPKI